MTEISADELQLRRRMRRVINAKPKNKNKLTTEIFDGVEHIKKRAMVIPYGYKVSEKHEGWLEPIPLEIAALKRAKEYIQNHCRYEEVADWLEKVTGRSISKMGLHKALRRGY